MVSIPTHIHTEFQIKQDLGIHTKQQVYEECLELKNFYLFKIYVLQSCSQCCVNLKIPTFRGGGSGFQSTIPRGTGQQKKRKMQLHNFQLT